MTDTTIKNSIVKTNRTKTSKKADRLAFIPADIKKAIDNLKLKPQTSACCINLACYIYFSSKKKDIHIDGWVPLSQIHFEENVSTDYLKHLKILTQEGIIEVNNFYLRPQGSNKGVCKQYRINPNLLLAKSVPIRYKNKNRIYQTAPIINQTLKMLKKLKIVVNGKQIRSDSDFPILENLIENDINEEWFYKNNKVNNLNPNIKYDYWIWDANCINKEKKLKHNGEVDKIKEAYPEKDLILYKGKIVVADVKLFIPYKIREIREIVLNSLVSIYDKFWICSRTDGTEGKPDANHRLDTNLTNLKTKYIKLLRYEGEPLVSIDLKNSQFLIFAHLLESCYNFLSNLTKNQIEIFLSDPQNHTLLEYYKFKGERIIKEKIKDRLDINIIIEHYVPRVFSDNFINDSLSMSCDCQDFIKSTKNGIFYDEFANVLTEKLEDSFSRNDAKKAMFSIAFSKHRFRSDGKGIFKETFPFVAHLIDGFKKKKIDILLNNGTAVKKAKKDGNASFAVMLQKIEAAIFIDDILPKLSKAGYKVFTKHDSFLVKKSQAQEVEAFVRAEFDSLFGVNEYKLEIEE
jgi:hypothetical protein